MAQRQLVDPEIVATLQAAGCVYAAEEARILAEAAHSPDELRVLASRRAAGEPLEYVAGWAEFCGLRIPVREGVFVPRRRSEFLTACAIDAARDASSRSDHSRVKVLDLCCGSGAIGLLVATRVAGIDLFAADNSELAVACARDNLAKLGAHVYLGDLFGALPQAERCSFDVIVANAPYVPTGEISHLPAEARLYEPAAALDGGPDGVQLHRRILQDARLWLSARGCVLIETNGVLAEATQRIARESGLAVEVREDADYGAIVVAARRRASS